MKSFQVLRNSFVECCWSNWVSMKCKKSKVFDGSDKESWLFTLIIRGLPLLFCLIEWILRLGVLNGLCSYMQQMLHVNCNCFLKRYNNINNHLGTTITVLLIIPISSTCFGRWFAATMLPAGNLDKYIQVTSRQHRRCIIPQTVNTV